MLHDVTGFTDDRIETLNARYRHHSATAVLENALADPEANERMRFHDRGERVDFRARIRRVENTHDLVAGSYTAAVTLGESIYASTNAWRLRSGGRALVTP